MVAALFDPAIHGRTCRYEGTPPRITTQPVGLWQLVVGRSLVISICLGGVASYHLSQLHYGLISRWLILFFSKPVMV